MFKKLIEESTGKSPWLFHINAGSCNGCDIELVSVLTPRYDAERLRIEPWGPVPRAMQTSSWSRGLSQSSPCRVC